MSGTVREQLNADIKSAMKAREAERLTVLRSFSAAIKQREVDERITLEDSDVIALADKLIKQRKDAAEQFTQGGREDLATKEKQEIEILSVYLPQQLSEDEVRALIGEAIRSSGASSMRDMGAVMNVLRPQLAGRADMGAVSKHVREQLA